jgi:uncharacterized protein YjbI with pentapeptide repeats
MTRLRGAWGRPLACAAVFAFHSPPTVAVAPLRLVDGSPVADTGAMRPIIGSPEAQLRTALAQVGYALVDSAPISAAIRAADLPTDGCHSMACAQAVAKATGAARVVTGEVNRSSRIIWDITVTLVDPAAGRVLHEEMISLRGDPATMLPVGWTSLARRIARHDPALGGTADSGTHAPELARRPPDLSRADVVRALDASTDDHPADFSHRDLSGLDLSGLNFKRADLQNCRAVGTNFSRDSMFAVNLSGAIANGANFSGAILDVTVWRGTDVSHANFRGASLYAAIMIGADLTGADLTDARVVANLTDAKLAHATLVNARMGADPKNQPMGLMRTDLTNATLAGADLTGADLRKAKLTRVDLTGATVANADFTNADLTDAVVTDIRGRDSARSFILPQ